MVPKIKSEPTLTEDTKYDPRITSGFRFFPPHRNKLGNTGSSWLEGKRISDGVWPYWRIHDKLYDLDKWADKHPGGKFWIEATKGTDITEPFESSHFGNYTYELLERFYVEDATTPRNSPFTFKQDGFFMTLKRKVTPIILKEGKSSNFKSYLIQDGLFCSFLFFYLMGGWIHSNLAMAASGIFLGMTVFSAHNFFHLKNNWRMYMWDFGFWSYKSWRITHVLSHHNFPNTIYDFEIDMFEPYVDFLPKTNEFLYRSTIILRFLWVTFVLHFKGYFMRLGRILLGMSKSDFTGLIPLFQMIGLMFLSGSITLGVWYWVLMHMTGSFYLHAVGLTVSHHHTEIFHEGDKIPKDMDWAMFQFTATKDRDFAMKSDILMAVSFGYHILHHIFPTVDHMKLHLLYDSFLETCKEFNIDWQTYDVLELVKGAYLQAIRSKPNSNNPKGLGK